MMKFLRRLPLRTETRRPPFSPCLLPLACLQQLQRQQQQRDCKSATADPTERERQRMTVFYSRLRRLLSSPSAASSLFQARHLSTWPLRSLSRLVSVENSIVESTSDGTVLRPLLLSSVSGFCGGHSLGKLRLGVRCFSSTELPPHIVVGMPALSPTMDQGNIAKWRKKEGDKIEVGDVICEIETDKATLEFESLEEGYLAKILVPEGSKDVHVGQPIAITVEDPDDIAKVPSTVSSVSSGSEVEEEKSTQGHTETREKVQKTSFSRISPAAKLLITEFGLDASSLTASGPRGTLSKGDVLAAIKSGTRRSKTSDSSQVKVSSSAPPQLEHTPKPASVSSSSSLPVDAHEDILNSQIRKVIAKRLLESKRGTPHLYLSSDVILDPLLSFRKELQVQHGVKVSVNDIVIKAVALALRNVPEANAYWNEGEGEATLCESVDISIAVATEKGLMTPIIRNADQKTLSAISSEAGILAVGRGNKVVAPLVDANATSLDASYSISTLFDACKTLGSLQQIHAHIIRRGFEQDNLLITRFVGFCNSFSAVPYAVSVFDRVSRPNIYLWNSILKGSCKSLLKNTLSLFRRMMRSDTPPDCYTFPSLLKACSHVSAVWEGRAIHCAILRCGVDSDLYVQTGLVDFYGKCMETGCARKVFDGMLERNEVSWTAMIVGCTCTGDIGAARELFEEMPCKNVATWNVMVDACAKRGDLKNARKFFDEMPERNAISYTSLIDGYAKAGDMASARFLFDQSVERDIFSWSALISGYAQNGQPKEALKIFLEMCEKNIKPDEFVMVGLMSACSQIGNLDLAKWVESLITQNAIDPSQAHVTAALIDMNAKCGNMERAMQLFGTLKSRDIISYCSLMQGLSIHGFGAEAVELFSKMLGEGIVPDNAAFIVVLTACSHKGLVEEGCQYFESMKNEYGIIPLPDHYACMVDLLSRAGRLRDAYDLIKSMPMEPHATAWGALLGACRLHCDIELGETVASRLFELEPQNAANYVLLSNIYATADRWADVSNIRATMTERGVRKIPGCSWI